MVTDFDVVVERDAEGYYVASVPALQGCHTQAQSLDQLMERVQEVIELCLEEQGRPTESLEFIGVQRVRIAS
ncbi:MAG: type II toxin-antitoxin system HicB family antitoxin [bacterium]|nr:type II toxin-antitoxin system HicB family antitoxin [bacterium]